MKKGRYNIKFQDGTIRKFNVYMNDYSNCFIFFEGSYCMVKKTTRYKGGWLWQLKESEEKE